MNLKNLQKGFTLVELLVVVGIISILAVAALVAINPAEAQKKARDAKRMKDIVTLQTVLEQYYTDNQGPWLSWRSSATSNNGNKSCTSSGWLGINVCDYIQQLPVDPVNGPGSRILADGSSQDVTLEYRVYLTNDSRYMVLTSLESKSNSDKVGACPYGNYYGRFYGYNNYHSQCM